jgi:5,10-methenyltetrahydrofolate synthetase
MSSKQELRKQLLAQRQLRSRETIITDSLAILAHLKPMMQGQLVGLYVPIQNEVDVSLLFREDIALPSIEEGRLVFRRYVEPLVPGLFGTMESIGEVCEPTLIVVPGIAFSKTGARLGYGQGYFDRYLTDSMCKVGVCMEEFFIAELPTESHDVLMNQVITPSGVKEMTPCTR